MQFSDIDCFHLADRYFSAFLALEKAITELAVCYLDKPMPIWVHKGADSAYEWLVCSLEDMWYRDGQPGNESRAYVGLVGAAPAHMSKIHAVNEAKHILQASGKLLKEHSPAEFIATKGRIGAERDRIQLTLNESGLARLHLKQAWRKLPVAEEPVRRVHFSWYTSGRTIKRITVAEADAALCRLDTDAPHIRVQREKLASLPSKELLAQVHTQAALMRANITYVDPLPTLKIHQAMNVGMPLFIPLASGEALPEHNDPSVEPPAERSWPKRRDARLLDDPFLPSIHVHRYRP